LRNPDDYHRPGDADPRFLPGWSSNWWATNHGLTLERLAYVTILTLTWSGPRRSTSTRSTEPSSEEGESKLTATRDLYVVIGKQVVVQLAQPLDSDSLAAKDLERNGETIHAACFKVADLSAAERYLQGKHIDVVDRDDETILTDPASTFHAPYRFTTATL